MPVSQEHFFIQGRRVPPPPRHPPSRYARCAILPTTRYDPTSHALLYSACEIQRRNAAYLASYQRDTGERASSSHASNAGGEVGGHRDHHASWQESVARPLSSSPPSHYTAVSDLSSREEKERSHQHPSDSGTKRKESDKDRNRRKDHNTIATTTHHHHHHHNVRGEDEDSEGSTFLHRGGWWQAGREVQSTRPRPSPRTVHASPPAPPPSRPPPSSQTTAGRQISDPHPHPRTTARTRAPRSKEEEAEEWRRQRLLGGENRNITSVEKNDGGGGDDRRCRRVPSDSPATALDARESDRWARENAARRERSAIESENWRRSRSRSAHPKGSQPGGSTLCNNNSNDDDDDRQPLYLPGGPGRINAGPTGEAERRGPGPGREPPSSEGIERDRYDVARQAENRPAHQSAARPLNSSLADSMSRKPTREPYPFSFSEEMEMERRGGAEWSHDRTAGSGGEEGTVADRRGVPHYHNSSSVRSGSAITLLDRIQSCVTPAASDPHYSSHHARDGEEHEPLLEGVELLPTQPELQGMQNSCPSRYQQTLERFTASQPPDVQPELVRVIQRYEGREAELCAILARIYGEEFDDFKATPQKTSRHESPMRSGSEPLPDPYPTLNSAPRGEAHRSRTRT